MTIPTFDHHAAASAPAPAPGTAAPAIFDHAAIDAWLAANLQLASADSTSTSAAAAKFPLATTDAEWTYKAAAVDQGGASNDELALAFGLGMDPQFALSGLFLDELGLGTAQFGATSSAAASKAGSPGLDDLPVLVPASPKPAVVEQVVEVVPRRTTPSLTIPAEVPAPVTTTTVAATATTIAPRPALRPLAPRPLAPRPAAPVQAPAAATVTVPTSTASPTSPVHPSAYPMVAIPMPAPTAAAAPAPTQYAAVPAMTIPGSAPVVPVYAPASTVTVPVVPAQAAASMLASSAAKSLSAYQQHRLQVDAQADVTVVPHVRPLAAASTGQRKPAIPDPDQLQYPARLIPLDAPIQSKKRKQPPTASTSATPKSGSDQDSDDENEDETVVNKRIKNTLSARRSRARRAAKMEFLESRVVDLEAENERLRMEVMQMRLRVGMAGAAQQMVAAVPHATQPMQPMQVVAHHHHHAPQFVHQGYAVPGMPGAVTMMAL
ncbi:hypothetical protein GGF31_004117 [Allomyces arbusculus]|nr:hypothetical protein GGF31_004117 [Allomyces arbusculus]